LTVDRLQEKNDLFYKLGALFDPLQRLVDDPDSYDEQEQAEVIARYCAEHQALIATFKEFSTGQRGHNYIVEYNKFHNALYGVVSELQGGHRGLGDIISKSLSIAKAAIGAIPIPRDSQILEAQTPFSTYCRIKDLIEANAVKSIVLIDAYMAWNIFHRFLRNVGDSVVVTLVTSEGRSHDRNRWESFLDISQRYALERGSDCYRLIVVGEGVLHDRWLLLDDKDLYMFGGSAKDAGTKKYFTLGRLDASPANLDKIHEHIRDGREFFGPSNSKHPER